MKDSPVERTERPRRGIQSIEVGGKILLALAESGDAMLLKDLAKAAAMSAAKAHPYLVSYGNLGLVEQDPISGRYELGPLALQMGLACLRRLNPVRLGTIAAAKLAEQINQTVALAVWGSAGPTIVHIEESSRPIHMNMRTGTIMSLFTATGRIFAAFLPPKLVERYVENFQSLAYPHRMGEPPDWKEVEAVIQDVREKGMSRTMGAPIPGVNAFSAPVFDHEGHIVLAVTILGPAGAFEAEWDGENARALKACADDLSHRLGSKPSNNGKSRN